MKNRRIIRSTAENRQRSNPYGALSYTEYRDCVLIGAYELNEIVRGIPYNMIPDLWLHDARFRDIFKRTAKGAAFIHYETVVQNMLPWLCVDMKEYCKRFA